jgi:hypothetical protein
LRMEFLMIHGSVATFWCSAVITGVARNSFCCLTGS